MGIRMSYKGLNDFFKKSSDIMHDCIVMALAKLGEECVARIRDRSADESWIDRTGNLRSSIGYSVYDHGEQLIQSAFQQVGAGTQGSSAGRKMLDELTKQYSKTYSLVVVAGMYYASYVQAIEGKDVLDKCELWARQEIDNRMQRAIQTAVKKINAL